MRNYYGIVRSPDYLEHFGILGMKWGVWNAETRARREGGKGGRDAKPEKIEKPKRAEKPKPTPEEIELKKIKREETRKKIVDGAKKLASVTYEVAKIAASVYMAKTMASVMVGQVINTGLQLSKLTATNQLLTNGYQIMSDPNTINMLNATMNTVDKAYMVANNPNIGSTLAFLQDPATMNTVRTLASAGNSIGSGLASTGSGMYALGNSTAGSLGMVPQTMTPAQYEQILRMAGM